MSDSHRKEAPAINAINTILTGLDSLKSTAGHSQIPTAVRDSLQAAYREACFARDAIWEGMSVYEARMQNIVAIAHQRALEENRAR